MDWASVALCAHWRMSGWPHFRDLHTFTLMLADSAVTTKNEV